MLVSFLIFVIAFIAFIKYWWKKRSIRRKVGENYEDNMDYKNADTLQNFSFILFIVFFYIFVGSAYADAGDFKHIPPMFGFLTSCITAVAFIIYWWKKRCARIKAGDNYENDEKYKKLSRYKRNIGIICVSSFFLMVFTVPEPTPEELAAREARIAAEQAEQAEQERIAAEKAEQERIAAEKAEQERIAAEKAEQERIAAEKSKQENNAATENKKPAPNKKEEKGFFAGLFDDAKEFAGGVLDNEVKVCDLENCSVYFSPTSKKFQQWGIIFKDEGYKITVIFKYPNGKKVSTTYYFKELSDGWKYQTELARANEWAKVKEDYVYDENNPSANDWNIASLIFQKSKHFPTLPEL